MKSCKYQIIKIIIVFLLLIPFRLPVGVLFIKLITDIANIGSYNLSDSILVANVIVTKVIYNLTLSIISVYNVEMLSKKIYGRNARAGMNDDIFWWTVLLCIGFFAYIIFDGVNTFDLYFAIN